MRFRFNRDTTAKAQQRTLGQLEMQQVQSAGPPFIADSRAGCSKDWVIVGQGGFRAFAAVASMSAAESGI